MFNYCENNLLINFNMINKILNKYPKKRPKLTKKILKIYKNEYRQNRNSKIISYFESWLHKSIKKLKNKKQKTLEIGAGTLNHLKYENIDNKNHLYDIIEPKKFLLKKNKFINKINNCYKNFENTPNNFYNRIISCATLEHLVELPKFLAVTSFKLSKRGYHSHSIPCEGCFSWNVVNRLLMGLIFKLRTGCNYNLLMQHEHVNNFYEIYNLIKYFYKKIEIKFSYPLYFNQHFSFYANITFSNARYWRCKKYLLYLKKNNKKFI